MSSLIKAKVVMPGSAEGELVVSRQTFSFFGGFDFHTGEVVDPKSDVHGMKLSGKIFAYPRGRGSSSTAGVILEALRQGTAPAAIINVESEKILAVGAIVAQVIFGWEIPVLSITDEEFQRLAAGRYVKISREQIEIM